MNSLSKKYGLIAGIAYISWQYTFFLSGMHKWDYAWLFALIPLAILLALIVAAMLQQKKAQGGYIRFNETLRIGLRIAAIAGFIYSIGTFVFYKWVDPEFINELAEQYRMQLSSTGTPPQEIDEQVKELKGLYPFRSSIMALAQTIAMGGLFTFISGLIVKKNPS